MRRLIANLDAEVRWRRDGRILSGGPRAAIAGWGSLLRVLALEEDRLWLPAPLAAERVVAVPGLARPGLDHGRLDDPPGTPTLRWAQAEHGVSRRAVGDASAVAPSLDGEGFDSLSVHRPPSIPSRCRPLESPAAVDRLADRLAHLPSPDAQDSRVEDIAAGVNHRAFGLSLARRLGIAAPGAGMARSIDEIVARLASVAEGAEPALRWVAKAPWTSSGRDRVWLDSGSSREQLEATAGALLRRHGMLALEPWDDRMDDFGQLLWVADEALEWLGMHRQRVDARGQFVGVEVPAAGTARDALGLTPDEDAALRSAALAVGDALHRVGYRGPVGLDARRIRTVDGGTALRRLGEINARLTIGHLAHALVARLELQGSAVLASSGAGARSGAERVIPLLAPSAKGGRRGDGLELRVSAGRRWEERLGTARRPLGSTRR
ncbi:MAG: hypothetical protein AAGC60_08715 [Acidobacteriota bacterium]